jgi:hypothetical protein
MGKNPLAKEAVVTRGKTRSPGLFELFSVGTRCERREVSALFCICIIMISCVIVVFCLFCMQNPVLSPSAAWSPNFDLLTNIATQ